MKAPPTNTTYTICDDACRLYETMCKSYASLGEIARPGKNPIYPLTEGLILCEDMDVPREIRVMLQRGWSQCYSILFGKPLFIEYCSSAKEFLFDNLTMETVERWFRDKLPEWSQTEYRGHRKKWVCNNFKSHVILIDTGKLTVINQVALLFTPLPVGVMCTVMGYVENKILRNFAPNMHRITDQEV